MSKRTGGKRGRQTKKGYSLKDPNRSGNYSVYVYEEYHHEESNRKRKTGYSKGYSYTSGWRSLGTWGNIETWQKVKSFFRYKYELNEEELEELHKEIEQDKFYKEVKRLKKKEELEELRRFQRED